MKTKRRKWGIRAVYKHREDESKVTYAYYYNTFIYSSEPKCLNAINKAGIGEGLKNTSREAITTDSELKRFYFDSLEPVLGRKSDWVKDENQG